MNADNPFREAGELQNFSPPAMEYAMTPARVDQLLLMYQFMLDVIDPEQYGHAMPPEVIRRASRILKLAPIEMPYLPPALPVSDFKEPVHEHDE